MKLSVVYEEWDLQLLFFGLHRKQDSWSNEYDCPIETGHTSLYMIIHVSSQKTPGINFRIKHAIAFAPLILWNKRFNLI